MRIAIVGGPHFPVPPQKYGGIERVIQHLIKGLTELGHEPIFIGTGDSTVECEVVPIVEKAIYFPKKSADVPAFKKYLAKIEKVRRDAVHKIAKRVDILHSHNIDLSGFDHLPTLTTIHNKIDFEEREYYLQRKHLYYVTVSQSLQKACPELEYIGTVYNGEDPQDFPIVDQPQDYLCFLGRFDRDKNPHLAIQLALHLGMKIKIAGKIDYHDDGYFEEEIQPYLNHPLVDYLGEIGFTEKVALLSNAKCNLHPTGFREPFGLAVLEAAYCGTPTLAINRGALPELIEADRTGVIVEDFVEGAHQIQRCFEMDRKYIANRARHLFNYKTMTEQYLKAYQRVIEIFQARDAQNNIISGLTAKARRELQEIWRKNDQGGFIRPWW